jgi:hypothetical protein
MFEEDVGGVTKVGKDRCWITYKPDPLAGEH